MSVDRGGSGVLRATAVVFASSSGAMLVGFLKSILAAYYFGTSGAMDAYLLALLLPDMAMQLARTGAFNFVPLFASERKRGEAEAWRAASHMLTYWLLLLLAAVGIAYLSSPLALSLLAPGLGGERRALALGLTQVLLLMAASVGAGRTLGVVLQADRRFGIAGLSEVAFQVASVAYLVAFHTQGIGALALAQVCGGFVQLAVVAFGLFARRRELRGRLDLRGGPVGKLVRLNVPVYLGDSGDKVNLVVTRAFASLLPVGAVSGLQYAYMPIEALHRILASSMTTALFPFLSRRFAEGDERRARASLGRAVVAAAVAFLPMAAAAWLLSDLAMDVLFERGSFDAASTRLAASALRLYAPAVVALALNELLSSAFHARQDTLTPMRAGFARVACNITLCALLAPSFGLQGIALATTVSLFVKLGVLAAALRGLFTAAERRRHLWRLFRVSIAAAALLFVVYPLAVYSRTPVVLERYAWPALLGLSLLCLGVYAAALWLFARREFLTYVAVLRRALRRPRRPSTRAHGPGGRAKASSAGVAAASGAWSA